MEKMGSRTGKDGGTVKSLSSEPTPLQYRYRGNMLGDRKGQCCELILGSSSQLPMIRFADGYTACVPRYTVRRLKEATCSRSSSSSSSPTSSFRS